MRAIKELQEHAKELAQILPAITVEQRVLFLMTEVGEVAREVCGYRALLTRRMWTRSKLIWGWKCTM
jgi:hypothetical protein